MNGGLGSVGHFRGNLLTVVLVPTGLLALGLALGFAVGSLHVRTAVAILSLIWAASAFQFLRDGPRVRVYGTLIAVSWIPLSVFGPRSPQLSEAALWFVLAVAAVGGLIGGQTAVKWDRMRGIPWVGFLIMAAGALLTFLSTKHSGAEMPLIRVLFVVPVGIAALSFYVVRTGRDAVRLLWVFTASSSAFALFFVLANVFNLGVGDPTAGRASLNIGLGFFGRVVVWPAGSATFAFAAVVGFGLWVIAPRAAARTMAALCVFASVFAMMLGFGRGGLVSTGVGVALMAFLMARVDRRRVIRGLAAALVVGALLGGFVILQARYGGSSQNRVRAEALLHPFTNPAQLQDGNVADRIHKWRLGLEAASGHPLGVGFFGYEDEPGGNAWAVHNVWLYYAIGSGVVGLIGLATVLLQFGAGFVKNLRRSDAEAAFCAAMGIALIAVFVVSGQFSPVFNDYQGAMMFWSPLAIAAAGCHRFGWTLPKKTPSAVTE